MAPMISFRSPNSLRQARLDCGLTQEVLARLSGIPQYTISRLELDRHRPSAEVAAAIAGALVLSVRAVFPGLEVPAAAPGEKAGGEDAGRR